MRSIKLRSRTVNPFYVLPWINMPIACTILVFLLIVAGDIHPNLGPSTQGQSQNKRFTVSHVNCRSLTSCGQANSDGSTKLDKIYHLAQTLSCDAICLTETWLDDTISNESIEVPGFSLHRRDINRLGGGVGIYIRKTIPVMRRVRMENGTTECIWLECKIKDKVCLLAVYYRPHGQRAGEKQQFLDDFNESVTLAMNASPDTL